MDLKNSDLNIFQNSCRICLLNEGHITILSLVVYENKEINVREALEICINSRVDENDELPKNVCNDCLFELLKANKFISKCRQSYDVLHGVKPFIADVDIKEEFSAEQKLIFDTSPASLTHDEKYPSELEKSESLLSPAHNTCAKLNKRKVKLKQQLISQVRTRSFLCEICTASFFRNTNLRRHMQTHSDQKRYMCKLCNRGFTTNFYFQEHMNEHNGIYAHLCETCGKRFLQYAKYYNHIQTHSEAVDKRIICNICLRVLSSKKALKVHLLTHGEKTLKCEFCVAKFSNITLYKNHLRKHTGEKPYMCSVCQKTFRQYGPWHAHMRIHTGVKPFTCHICSKSFTQRTHLLTHMKTHTKDKAFGCSYCGKCFSDKGYLKVHTRIHTGEKPHVCSICTAGFYTATLLRKHIRVHHKTEM